MLGYTAVTRRTKGAGSLRLRGRVWWITYYVHGRPIAESAHTDDKDKAANFLKQRIGEAAAGRDVAADRATINDICGLVLADYRTRNLRDLTTVKWRYEAHVKPALGTLLASRFGPKQAREFVERRRAEDATNATINRELAIVRRGFSLALQEDPPPVRRAPHIPKLEEDNARQGFIEQGQYQALLSALPEHLKALLVVGYHCGNRLGELRKLRWSQVDFEAKEIRIEKS
jgi:integrase